MMRSPWWRVFRTASVRWRARAHLTGLRAPIERKTAWQLSEAAGDPSPDGVQCFLDRAVWSADALRDVVRSHAAEHLAGPGGGTRGRRDWLRQAGPPLGRVQRQHSGTAVRAENCQLGVFLAYAGECGRALIDRELHLPRSWTDDPDRCARAGIGAERVEAGVLARARPAEAVIARALDAGVEAGWVAADSAYGRGSRFRDFLEARRMPYVVEVPVKQTVVDLDGDRRVGTLVARTPAEAWHTVSAGPGVRGERGYDWAWATVLSFGDLPIGFVRTLPARRSLRDPTDIAYCLCFHPDAIAREENVRVAGARWAIEECFQAAKNESGLDHYQVRKWGGWYRHVSMAMLAHAFLAVTAAADPKAHAGWADSRSPRSVVSWRRSSTPYARTSPDRLPVATPPSNPRPTIPLSTKTQATQQTTDRNLMVAIEISEYRLPVPDGELHIREAGAGAPVVLLHGGALDSRMWEDQLPVLARAGYRVTAFDARGHGQSTLPTTPFRQCDDAAAVVRHLGEEAAVLVGLSMGGGAAVDTALEHPDLVRAVVAVGSGTAEPTFADPFVLRIFETWRRAQENDDIEGWLDAFLLFASGPHRGLDEVNPEVVSRIRRMGRHTVLTHARPEAVQPEHVAGSWERLGQIAVPVLAVLGELDASDHREMGVRLASSVQQGRRAAIAGTAHYPPMERPDAFNEVLLEFLGSLP